MQCATCLRHGTRCWTDDAAASAMETIGSNALKRLLANYKHHPGTETTVLTFVFKYAILNNYISIVLSYCILLSNCVKTS